VARSCLLALTAIMRLALFDLDHTLLSGDSDVLWCDFLIDQGLLEARSRERSDEMAARYAAGTIIPRAYYDFYAGTLAGYEPSDLHPLRERFLCEVVRPRIPEDDQRSETASVRNSQIASSTSTPRSCSWNRRKRP